MPPMTNKCCEKCAAKEGEYAGICIFSHCPCHPEEKGSWEDTIIPEYSKLAFFNSDSVDGYDMVQAVPYIKNLLATERAELVEEVEKLNFRPQSPQEDGRDYQNKKRAYLQACFDFQALLEHNQQG